jgi:hypothetical protein
MKTKQTAVEWLEMEIVKLESRFAIPNSIYELCEQAKQMEKEQIINSFNEGSWIDWGNPDKHAEQYYNETYDTTRES